MAHEDFIMKSKVDFCFKELMEDPEVRKGFISAVLKIAPEAVAETVLIPTHLRKDHKKDKLGILDICVRLNGNQKIDMEIHVLELPKLEKREYPESELLDWARFFNAERKEDLRAVAEKNEYIGKAYNRLTHISADEEKRLEYEAWEKAIRDHNYLLKVNLEQGIRIGEDRGEKRMISLLEKMSDTPDASLIPRLGKDPEFLQQMYEKYGL